MSFCSDCFKAVTHDGTPEGQMTEIGGIPCYVATPTVDYPKDKIVLFLTDAHGMGLVNNKLLADDYARNGFKTIVPDLFNGDPVPVAALSPDAPPFDWPSWLPKHGSAQTRPLIDAVMSALKAEGVSDFACCGYCFGARYTFDLAFERLIKVAAVAHPSLLKRPEDIETYRDKAIAPLLINGCTHDPVFPPADQDKADEILKDFTPGYKRVYWEGATHGFAVKGDLSDPEVWKAKSGAFKETVEWFNKYM
ncbi:Dienelactone hydrolase endo-1,3,1,4-beta-D-glucanase [Mycena sanguinolenta]|uniref:Dienelactone hydrolase endo-1,3,1,4-beta-D-glucanase n=1 Tax=Mycena sanguinolenta TaxID=230812 RepID=A0A8H7DGC3_9AGAR|nr:Dienelactone hydrolase endo-1,3,1,4-beta-D-glucanase [Mycena sanguinolenta]